MRPLSVSENGWLEHAIAERSDFWWAREIALPQAARSRTSHR
jgi:hypothetical protein